MVLIKKVWTIIHGFDRFFEKNMDYSYRIRKMYIGFGSIFEKMMDYSHGLKKKSMDYSSWF